MGSLDGVVKVEVRTKEPLNIRSIFSKCGEMYALFFLSILNTENRSYVPSQVSAYSPVT